MASLPTATVPPGGARKMSRLQWVHGRITVVMLNNFVNNSASLTASMGPRSDNRGYDRGDWWMVGVYAASMGPRSDNRGYAPASWLCGVFVVHASMGPRSDNRGYGNDLLIVDQEFIVASMGPRSDNRGYARDRRERHRESESPAAA